MVILGSLLLLTGCANDEMSKEDEDTQPTTTQEEVEEMENESEEQKSTTNNPSSNLEEYKEFKVVAQYIDIETYQGLVQTDNRGKRVILFEDSDGHERYKSIFIKHDNRLKIISFDDDGLLYNDKIK